MIVLLFEMNRVRCDGHKEKEKAEIVKNKKELFRLQNNNKQQFFICQIIGIFLRYFSLLKLRMNVVDHILSGNHVCGSRYCFSHGW